MINTEKFSSEKEVSLLDYYRILRKNYLFIIIFVGIVIGLTLFYSLTLPNIYEADGVILPFGNKMNNNVFALAGQISGLEMPSSFGGAGFSKLMPLLKSRTFGQRVVEKMGLRQVFFKGLWDPIKQKWKVKDSDIPSLLTAVNIFQSMISYEEEMVTGILRIKVQSEDRVLAAQIVNTIIEELQEYIDENQFTETKRQLVYLNKKVLINRRALLDTGKEISEYYKKNRIPLDSTLVDVPLDDDPNLVDESQPKLATVTSVTDLNSQLKTLDKQLQEKETTHKSEVVKNIPQQVYLEYLMQRKKILVNLDSLLSQQYEVVKMDQVRNDISFQVIDIASVPQVKIKPHRRKMLISAFVISIFLASFIVYVKEFVKGMRN